MQTQADNKEKVTENLTIELQNLHIEYIDESIELLTRYRPSLAASMDNSNTFTAIWTSLLYELRKSEEMHEHKTNKLTCKIMRQSCLETDKKLR